MAPPLPRLRERPQDIPSVRADGEEVLARLLVRTRPVVVRSVIDVLPEGQR
jgi:hypothetical protein